MVSSDCGGRFWAFISCTLTLYIRGGIQKVRRLIQMDITNVADIVSLGSTIFHYSIAQLIIGL